MATDDEDRIIKEKLKPVEKWKNKFKDDWNYKKKLVVFEDADGNIVTPTTTTTTTTTTTPRPNITSPQQNVTKYTQPTKFSSIAVVTTIDPRSDKVKSADTTELIKIVGITCASLIGIILLAVIVIRCCRKTTAKRKERVTVRRPLHDAEREEHIYAEIEPLQAARTPSPGGASGSSRDVALPSKKSKKRRGGVSSFRALSTRIYRFFNADTDNQSVFYNRTNQQATVEEIPPEPPERNIANGKKTKRVNRFESTASRRPLLDGDSRTDVSPRDSTSSAADMRGNIYNPLLRESEGRAPSGPYDHLTLSKTQSGNIRDSGVPPSPHDYFTLEKTSREVNPDADGEQKDSGYLTESNSVPQDSVVIENELHGGIDTIEEESELTGTPKNHDYFILEPHQRESMKKSDANRSVKSNQSTSASEGSSKVESPIKDHKTKPEVTPRVTKTSEGKSPTKSIPTTPANDLSSPYEVAVDIDASVKDTQDVNNTEVKSRESKEETYVLSKLGDAPKPPEAVNDDEYLSPVDVEKKPDYVDVFPNPPPRSSSLQPHELGDHQSPDHSSPSHSKIPPKHESTSPVHKTGNSSPKHKQKASQKDSHKSPSHKSPSHKPVSPTRSKVETDI
ncbi:uncharacterized protein LOC123529354 [Mercenaria mercenaria]|uniref:uncharacterized protein LOC123529354 n=1 Tax=Mercenaria mercenaria TaxID=6596 RepID=UPI00234F0D79|nr:uncharacterized protein LOC123529354 [Mercenaria mercenaria]